MNTRLKNRLNILFLPSLFLTLLFTACSSDEEPVVLIEPTISEVEVGLYNNELGVVGEDFHFNAEILAGELIETVKINIIPRSEETYVSDWSFEIIWDKYNGLKNAKIHQHFDIPSDAPKGVYDFVITVIEQNGAFLEDVRSVELIDAEDFPEVNPHLSAFGVDKIDVDGTGGFNNFYNNGSFRDEDDPSFSVNESIWSSIQIGGLKGDGIMYALLIKKSLNHLPETVEEIDFSKVIVTEVKEHVGYEEVKSLNNSYNTDYNNHYFYGAALKIGATEDNNLPNPNPISGTNAWESETYYYGFVYTNTSYLKSTFHYIEFDIKME